MPDSSMGRARAREVDRFRRTRAADLLCDLGPEDFEEREGRFGLLLGGGVQLAVEKPLGHNFGRTTARVGADRKAYSITSCVTSAGSMPAAWKPAAQP